MKNRKKNARKTNLIIIFSLIGGFFTFSLVLGIISVFYFSRGSKTNKAEIFEASASQSSEIVSVAIHSVQEYGTMLSTHILESYETNQDISDYIENELSEFMTGESEIILIDSNGVGYTKGTHATSFTFNQDISTITEEKIYVGSLYNDSQVVFGFVRPLKHTINATDDGEPIVLSHTFVGKNYVTLSSVRAALNVDTDSYLMDGEGNILHSNTMVKCGINGAALFGLDEPRNVFSTLQKDEFKANIGSEKNFYARFYLDGVEFVASVNKYNNLPYWQVEIVRLQDVYSATDQASIAVLLTTSLLCLLMMSAAVVLAVSAKKNKETKDMLQKEAEINKYLEYASNAKTTFLFNMSHDIRTPMNAIIGFTDVAERHIDNKEKALDALSKVRSSSNHLLALINDVLDMSRIESGKVEISVKPLNIIESLENTSYMLQSFAEKKKVNYEFTTKNIKHKNVKMDLLHVNQIIVNIVSNAIKYNHENGNVKFSIEEVDSEILDYAKFKFVCADTGIGMSEDFLEHVFETFARDNAVRSTSTEGTGLGLSIAKSLVDVMNGDISVESELGKGTTFTFMLPFEITESAQETEVLTPLEEVDLTGKHLLIVEDNELNREIARDILQESGFIVDTAEDGAKGVEIVKEKGIDYYDIILMDIQMPVMNGYEATKEIRKLFPDKHVPIIALSANAFEEDKQKSHDAGMDDHQSKPIVVPELMESIRRLLSK